jgi:predicted outer membrane protein
MRSKLIYCLCIVVPFAAYSACSSDNGTGGTGGTSGFGTGGISGHAGNASGAAGTSGGGGNGGARASGGNGGSATAVGGTTGSGGMITGGGGRAGAAGSGNGGATSAGAGGFTIVGGSGGIGGTGGVAGGTGGGGGRAGNGGAAGSGGRAGTAGFGAAAGEADLAGAGGASADLSDGEIVQILVTANAGEVAAAGVAQTSARTPAVVNFAQMMVSEHTAAEQQTLTLVAGQHIAPEPSDVSRVLDSEATTMLATLSQTAPTAFDRVYIQGQVDMHQEVLTLIDTRLLPNAMNVALRTLLTNTRATVARHLAEAMTILGML